MVEFQEIKMGFGVAVALILVALSVFYLWAKMQFRYWEKRGFEYVKPVEFPFGSIKGVGYREHFSIKAKKAYMNFRRKTPVVGMYFFTSPVALILDLDVIKHVMIKDFNNFHDRGLYHNPIDPLSEHLFAIEGSDWKNMRAKLTPTFTSGKMKAMFHTVLDISDKMVDYFKKLTETDNVLEMKELLSQFTTDVIGNVAFGLEINSMENSESEFRRMGRKAFNTPPTRTLKIFFLTCFPKLARRMGLWISDKEITDFFIKSVRDTVEYREKNNIQRNDFLNLLIQIKNHGKIDGEKGEGQGTWTIEELTAQCFLFFLAGFESEKSF